MSNLHVRMADKGIVARHNRVGATGCRIMTPNLRLAASHDLHSLCHLEQIALNGDRFSRRQFHHLLHRAHALTLVAEGMPGICWVTVPCCCGVTAPRPGSIPFACTPEPGGMV
ncbi:hypothetical protein A8U91_03157 [Halomonas elongata]|uniref:Uncharacterized protein n=1 Tax=Halomonas elongata TaxID=2746 RepID=A0A1B8NVT9_HALEL|nr:hypothetical protein A8U91_03157 [Halomonas elongata]